MEAALDQFFECHAIVIGDSSEADMAFLFFILGAEVERGAWFGHRTEPIFAGDVGNVLHQFDDAFAGAAFTREKNNPAD